MEIKKICFLVNYNQYEVKRSFTEKFAEALERKGVETLTFDFSKKRLHENVIEKIKEAEPTMTASFNSILPLPDDRYLWDLLEIPHLSMLLDPSLYSVALINSPYSIISCVDRFDCYGLATQNFDRVFFMPHAVERELFERPPEKNKIYDVVFLGSCYNYESLRKAWEKELSKPICDVLEQAIELLFSDNKTSLQDALVIAWRESLLPPHGVDFLKLFTYLDHYTRGYDRVQLIGAIEDCQVHVFGEIFEDDPNAVKGWKQQLKGHDNIVFHEPVTYPESLEILRRSKICLNSNPFFKDGSHERIFNGAAAGALVATMDNLYVREQFVEGEDLLLYQPGHWGGLNEKIHYYLNHEEERQAAAGRLAVKVKQHHTWDNRAALLIETMPKMIEKSLQESQEIR